jgi:hypothetical protein
LRFRQQARRDGPERDDLHRILQIGVGESLAMGRMKCCDKTREGSFVDGIEVVPGHGKLEGLSCIPEIGGNRDDAVIGRHVILVEGDLSRPSQIVNARGQYLDIRCIGADQA